MFRAHDADEIRRFDLMKLAVLVALLLLLVLSWFIFRGQSAPNLAGEDMIATPLATAIDGSVVIAPGEEGLPGEGAAATPVAETSAEAEAPAATPVNLSPSILPPPEALATGNATLSGMAAPGSQVFLLVDDQPAGVATTGVDGVWSLALDLPAGIYTIQAQVMDNLGNVSGVSDPLTIVVREPEELVTGESLVNVPAVDPETGAYLLTGIAAPGSMVTISSDGTVLGAVTADEAGNWVASVGPGVSGDVQIETVDSAGNVISSSVTLPSVEETGAAETATPEGETAGASGGSPGESGAEATPPPAEEPIDGPQTITGILSAQPDRFSTLLSALETAGLADEFDGASSFTLFAPTNEAFAQLPEVVIEGLIANPQALSQVLQYHAARGLYTSADLQVVAPATLNNRLWTITLTGDSLFINDATVMQADMAATNGVVHVVDRVLVPPLAAGVRPPVIDESGVPVFSGPDLTVVGTAQPGSTILLELNGEPFGAPAIADSSGFWQVAGQVTPAEYSIVAYMLDAGGVLQAISRAVMLDAK